MRVRLLRPINPEGPALFFPAQQRSKSCKSHDSHYGACRFGNSAPAVRRMALVPVIVVAFMIVVAIVIIVTVIVLVIVVGIISDVVIDGRLVAVIV